MQTRWCCESSKVPSVKHNQQALGQEHCRLCVFCLAFKEFTLSLTFPLVISGGSASAVAPSSTHFAALYPRVALAASSSFVADGVGMVSSIPQPPPPGDPGRSLWRWRRRLRLRRRLRSLLLTTLRCSFPTHFAALYQRVAFAASCSFITN